MPEIRRSLEIPDIQASDLYDLCIEAFQQVGGEITGETIQSESPFIGEISAFIPSVWGWGGMKMKAELKEKGEVSRIDISGYIAQLATRPLKEKVNQYIKGLTDLVNHRLGYRPPSLTPSRSPRPAGAKLTGEDVNMVILVVVGLGVLMISSLFLRVPEAILASIVIPLVYLLVRNRYKRDGGSGR